MSIDVTFYEYQISGSNKLYIGADVIWEENGAFHAEAFKVEGMESDMLEVNIDYSTYQKKLNFKNLTKGPLSFASSCFRTGITNDFISDDIADDFFLKYTIFYKEEMSDDEKLNSVGINKKYEDFFCKIENDTNCQELKNLLKIRHCTSKHVNNENI